MQVPPELPTETRGLSLTLMRSKYEPKEGPVLKAGGQKMSWAITLKTEGKTKVLWPAPV